MSRKKLAAADRRVAIGVTLPAATVNYLDRLAQSMGVSRSAMIELTVYLYQKENDNHERKLKA